MNPFKFASLVDPFLLKAALAGTLVVALASACMIRVEIDAERQDFDIATHHQLAHIDRELGHLLHEVDQTVSLTTAMGPFTQAQILTLERKLLRDFPFLTGLEYQGAHSPGNGAPTPWLTLAGSAAAVPPPGLSEAIATARVRNEPAATPLRPADGGASGYAMTVVLPHPFAPAADSVEPRSGPDGWSKLTIVPGPLFARVVAATRPEDDALSVEVLAAAPAPTSAPLYASAAPRAPAPVACWPSCAPQRHALALSWAGQPFTLVVQRPARGIFARHLMSMLLFGITLLAAVAAIRHFQHHRRQARKHEALATTRTGELWALNNILLRDIEERSRSSQELARSHEQVRQLAEHNARVKENERKRIAREIHDDLGQTMAALKMDLSMMLADTPAQGTRERLQSALTQIDHTLTNMRLIINELRPPVLDLGLDAAIEWEASKFARRTGIACQIDVSPIDACVSDEIATALYRITQESLTNIMRHANATAVMVKLVTEPGWIFLTITDNGVGLENGCRRKEKSFGLIGIAERVYALGGAFTTDSTAATGTRLAIALPCQLADDSAARRGAENPSPLKQITG